MNNCKLLVDDSQRRKDIVKEIEEFAEKAFRNLGERF